MFAWPGPQSAVLFFGSLSWCGGTAAQQVVETALVAGFLCASPGAQLTEQPNGGPEQDEAQRRGVRSVQGQLRGVFTAQYGASSGKRSVSPQNERPVRACAREGSASSLAECKQDTERDGESKPILLHHAI